MIFFICSNYGKSKLESRARIPSLFGKLDGILLLHDYRII